MFTQSITCLLLLTLFVVACSGEPVRQRTPRKPQALSQRSLKLQSIRKLARQQESVTPYPSADELKPEVAFEDGHVPDEVYGGPDAVYGPPELEQPTDQLPSEDAPEDFAPNPDAEEFQPSDLEESKSQQPEQQQPDEAQKPTRLVNRKKTRSGAAARLTKTKSRKSQRLVAAPLSAGEAVDVPLATLPLSAQLSTEVADQYFVLNPQSFPYSPQYQIW